MTLLKYQYFKIIVWATTVMFAVMTQKNFPAIVKMKWKVNIKY